jgi:hypothetical protein
VASVLQPGPGAGHAGVCRNAARRRINPDGARSPGPGPRRGGLEHQSEKPRARELGTVAASAFVTAEGHTYLLLPGVVCLLALAELLWHGKRLLQAFALGHVEATLVVAIGLAVAIDAGWLPMTVTGVSDVGLSYGAVAVLGTLTAAIPIRWRAARLTGWLTVAAATVTATVAFCSTRSSAS